MSASLLDASCVTLSVHDSRPCTTSLDIAAHFGKRHRDVLRDIRNVMARSPQDFNERNFAPISYADSMNRKKNAFAIFRDGFMLLVMGYNGDEAFKMKHAFLEAFNATEAELARRAAPDAADIQELEARGKRLRTSLRVLREAGAEMDAISRQEEALVARRDALVARVRAAIDAGLVRDDFARWNHGRFRAAWEGVKALDGILHDAILRMLDLHDNGLYPRAGVGV